MMPIWTHYKRRMGEIHEISVPLSPNYRSSTVYQFPEHGGV